MPSPMLRASYRSSNQMKSLQQSDEFSFSAEETGTQKDRETRSSPDKLVSDRVRIPTQLTPRCWSGDHTCRTTAVLYQRFPPHPPPCPGICHLGTSQIPRGATSLTWKYCAAEASSVRWLNTEYSFFLFQHLFKVFENELNSARKKQSCFYTLETTELTAALHKIPTEKILGD